VIEATFIIAIKTTNAKIIQIRITYNEKGEKLKSKHWVNPFSTSFEYNI